MELSTFYWHIFSSTVYIILSSIKKIIVIEISGYLTHIKVVYYKTERLTVKDNACSGIFSFKFVSDIKNNIILHILLAICIFEMPYMFVCLFIQAENTLVFILNGTGKWRLAKQ